MKKIKRLYYLILIVILLGLILFTISFIDGYFGERVQLYLHQKLTLDSSKNIALVLDNIIDEELLDNIITWEEKENNVKMAINTNILNRLFIAFTDELQQIIDKRIYKEEIELPLSIIISETLFGSIGPSLTIKAYPISSFEADIISSVEEYGINNNLFRLDMFLKITYQVLIPFSKREITVDAKVPIIMQLVQGEVPQIYTFGNLLSN